MTSEPRRRERRFRADAAKRILVLDGAMGTMIQALPPAARRTSAASASPTGRATLQGNNDLLTSPSRTPSRRSTVAYLDAGADIVETNTFSSTAHRPGRLRHGGARLRAEPRGRPARPRGGRRGRPPRRRTGRASSPAPRPDQPHRSISPDVNNPGFRAITFDELRRRLRRGGARADRGRRRPAPDRDDLRHAQRQGGARSPSRRSFAETGRRAAGDDLRHDHRPLRPHALRPDADAFWYLGAPRPVRSPSGSTARSAPRRCAPTSPSSRASPTR